MNIKKIALSLIAVSAIAVPLSAQPITWTFDDATSSSMGTAGILLSDGSTLTGSFDYACDAGNGGTCDGVGSSNSLGSFSNVSISVSGGAIIPTGQTWYILQNADDSASDNQSIFFVNYNPATVADGTNVSGGTCPDGAATNACDPGYVISLSIFNDPQISGASPTSVGMDDSGGLYAINFGAPPQSGYCVNSECSAVNTSGTYASQLTTAADTTGHIWANAYVAPPPPTGPSTPEPATMALAGSALLALGFARRKLASRS